MGIFRHFIHTILKDKIYKKLFQAVLGIEGWCMKRAEIFYQFSIFLFSLVVWGRQAAMDVVAGHKDK